MGRLASLTSVTTGGRRLPMVVPLAHTVRLAAVTLAVRASTVIDPLAARASWCATVPSETL